MTATNGVAQTTRMTGMRQTDLHRTVNEVLIVHLFSLEIEEETPFGVFAKFPSISDNTMTAIEMKEMMTAMICVTRVTANQL